MLAYDTPVQARTRLATAEFDLGGQRIRAGQTLFLLLGGASRDPRAFPDPDRFERAGAPRTAAGPCGGSTRSTS